MSDAETGGLSHDTSRERSDEGTGVADTGRGNPNPGPSDSFHAPISEALREHIEASIYRRDDGAVVWESILSRKVSQRDLDHILDLVADHSYGERIDWDGVWEDFDRSLSPAPAPEASSSGLSAQGRRPDASAGHPEHPPKVRVRRDQIVGEDSATYVVDLGIGQHAVYARGSVEIVP